MDSNLSVMAMALVNKTAVLVAVVILGFPLMMVLYSVLGNTWQFFFLLILIQFSLAFNIYSANFLQKIMQLERRIQRRELVYHSDFKKWVPR